MDEKVVSVTNYMPKIFYIIFENLVFRGGYFKIILNQKLEYMSIFFTKHTFSVQVTFWIVFIFTATARISFIYPSQY